MRLRKRHARPALRSDFSLSSRSACARSLSFTKCPSLHGCSLPCRPCIGQMVIYSLARKETTTGRNAGLLGCSLLFTWLTISLVCAVKAYCWKYYRLQPSRLCRQPADLPEPCFVPKSPSSRCQILQMHPSFAAQPGHSWLWWCASLGQT